MRDSGSRRGCAGWRPWRILRFDAPLLVFLTIGWSLIFATATLALQRDAQHWLPVNLGSRVSADYSVDKTETSKLAPVRPQIIEAVKQDALVVRPPTPVPPVLAEATTPPPIFSPTPTPTLPPAALTVSAGGPYTGTEGNLVSLIAEVPSPMSDSLTYYWDLDDDGLYDDAEGISAAALFYDEGEYTIGIQAINLVGRVATDTTTVSVSNVAPTVNVGGDRYTNEGQEISFSAGASDPGHDLLLYYWDFGDGAGTTGTLSPHHTYLDNGNYIVHFRAEDNDGGITAASFVTYVSNVPPIADAGPDQAISESNSLTFKGTAADPGVLDTLTYAWDLNYNGFTFTPDVFGHTASAVYSDGPTTIVAALRVRDKDGGEAIDTATVTVRNVAPTITSVSNNSPVGEGVPVTLWVSATDVGSDTLTYAFDWENDGIFDAVHQPATISHVWYNQGDYTVGIRADDGDGGRVFTTATVSAFNVAPTAVANLQATYFEGSVITFDGSGSGDPGIYDTLTYQWNFGDGSPIANGITVTHAYADNSVYSATLTVTDDSSAADTDFSTVSILNANPIADAGLDRTLNESAQLINFVGVASDPGTADTLILAWDFDFDGTNFDEDATGPSADWAYLDGPASYVVAFRARDDDYPRPPVGGDEIGEAIDTLQITVNNVPPAADAGPDQATVEMAAVTFNGSATDPGADTLTYEWDFDYDGSTFDVNATGQTAATSYPTGPATYAVALRVTDDDGDSGLDTAQVTVDNAPPTAEAGGPYSGDEGLPIMLTGTGTDPTSDPLTYTWDLDYDSIFETPGQVVTNTWPDDGVYTVTLRVDDGRGGIATDDAIVTVNNVPPTADAGGPYTTTAGIATMLTGTGTDVPSDTLTYAWDLDDDSIFDDGTGQVVTYTWTVAGIYTVTLQVDDGDGGITTDTTTVNVNSLYPFAWLGVPYFLALSKWAISPRRRRVRNL